MLHHIAEFRSLLDDSWCIYSVVYVVSDLSSYVGNCMCLKLCQDYWFTSNSSPNKWIEHKPWGPTVGSCGPISSCLEPHGHRVSTTNNIKLLCGTFWTLNGRSQPDEWQLVNFPFNGVLEFNLSGCSTNKSVFKSHGRVNDESGTNLACGVAGAAVAFGVLGDLSSGSLCK